MPGPVDQPAIEIKAAYGLSTCSAETFSTIYERKLSLAADVHAHELQLVKVTSHASGDHCVPIGRAFSMTGFKDRAAYILTSTNRMEVRAAVIVPNQEFASIQPLFEALSADTNFTPRTYTVDDAHNKNQETMGALNKHKAADAQKVVDVPNDLKHAEQRFINTLTCNELNKHEFRWACRYISEAFLHPDEDRDAYIKARLTTESAKGGLPIGAKVQTRVASSEHPSETKIWKDATDCLTDSDVERMVGDGSFKAAFKHNRRFIRWPKEHTRRELERLRTQMMNPDFGCCWNKPKGEGGQPHYTYSRGSISALDSILDKLDYIVPKTIGQPRYRTLPESDGRDLPVEISLEGSNFTENANGQCETALSAGNGYGVNYANGLLLRKVAGMNVTARIRHPDDDGQREPQLYHTDMELVRAHNAICDRYGLPRAHPLHPDLPPRNQLEKQALAYFQSIVEPPPIQLPPNHSSLSYDDICLGDAVLMAIELPTTVIVHEALRISATATTSDTPPPTTLGSAGGSSLGLQPRPITITASSALVPSWLALPLSSASSPQSALAALGVRQLPSLAHDGTPFDRPFHVAGLPSVSTLVERRADAKAAKAELAALATAAAFNEALGTGELFLAEGEEWMLTHDTKNSNLCKPGLPCYDCNHTTDSRTGRKRAPVGVRKHDAACLQRRCLEVQLALKNGHRVVKKGAKRAKL